MWLMLGEDAVADARAKVERVSRALDEWESVGVDVGIDHKDGPLV